MVYARPVALPATQQWGQTLRYHGPLRCMVEQHVPSMPCLPLPPPSLSLAPSFSPLSPLLRPPSLLSMYPADPCTQIQPTAPPLERSISSSKDPYPPGTHTHTYLGRQSGRAAEHDRTEQTWRGTRVVLQGAWKSEVVLRPTMAPTTVMGKAMNTNSATITTTGKNGTAAVDD